MDKTTGGLLHLVTALTLTTFIASAAHAQDPNECDEAGEAPDVIVGDLHQVNNYGALGDIYAYSVGTVSCNQGTCWLNWISSTNEHPVIGQNMFRVKDGRITQIGQSWLKHGFFALSEGLCSEDCVSTSGSHLGVNCSDPYSANLNGSQARLGPKFEVNPTTGEFPFPPTAWQATGDSIYKRLQVHRDDLDPALNAGARYFVEGHYITQDDAAAGNADNNASHREIVVNPTTFNISLTASTKRGAPGIQAWSIVNPEVAETNIDVPGDGRYVVAATFSDLGGGVYHYEYAVQNLNSHRSAQAFWIPVPTGSTVTNLGFHDVAYHSGEPWDDTDWEGVHDVANSRVIWKTQPYEVNPNANALRWGTLYNFWFDVDAPPALGSVAVDLFRPGQTGDPDTSSAAALAPMPCDNNGICGFGENCNNCPGDCKIQGPPTGFCGDGICEIALGEDCLNCADCAGVQGGNPDNRYCCGAGGGVNPVDCTDSRCRSGGFSCGSTNLEICCGDGTCDPLENSCACSRDCGAPPSFETVCDDGVDDDCDGQQDCGDLDCCTFGACVTGMDNDGDGIDDCDCDDSNNQVWSAPGEVAGLVLSQDAMLGTALDWSPPAEMGGLAVSYTAVRSSDPTDWAIVSQCVQDPDPTDTTAFDDEDPGSGQVHLYLIRAENACPQGLGPLGEGTGGAVRVGDVCP